MTKIKQYLPYIGLFIIGLAFGRFSLPAHVEVRTETKTVEVMKWQTEVNKDENKNKVTKITEEIKPDGTKIIHKEITDKGTIDTRTDSSGSDNKTSDIKTEKITEYSKDLSVNIMAGINILHPGDGYVYGASFSKRIFGPIWLGAVGQSNRLLSITAGLTF